MFHTPIGIDLPFTYPPLAAIVFCPFAWLHMPAASVVITALTLALLVVSTAVVLTGLDVWATSAILPGPAWLRRCWLAVVIVAPATDWLEPIASNFAFGQINVVLMTLVIADCVPRRTPWPRGLLLGLGIALKLTPAVFLLYFLLRRDNRAALRSETTLRYGWLDVTSRPCTAAVQVLQVMRRKDPSLTARPCGPGCPVR